MHTQELLQRKIKQLWLLDSQQVLRLLEVCNQASGDGLDELATAIASLQRKQNELIEQRVLQDPTFAEQLTTTLRTAFEDSKESMKLGDAAKLDELEQLLSS